MTACELLAVATIARGRITHGGEREGVSRTGDDLLLLVLLLLQLRSQRRIQDSRVVQLNAGKLAPAVGHNLLVRDQALGAHVHEAHQEVACAACDRQPFVKQQARVQQRLRGADALHGVPWAQRWDVGAPACVPREQVEGWGSTSTIAVAGVASRCACRTGEVGRR